MCSEKYDIWTSRESMYLNKKWFTYYDSHGVNAYFAYCQIII